MKHIGEQNFRNHFECVGSDFFKKFELKQNLAKFSTKLRSRLPTFMTTFALFRHHFYCCCDLRTDEAVMFDVFTLLSKISFVKQLHDI